MKRNIILIVTVHFFCSFSYSQDSTWSLQKCIDYGLNNNILLQQTSLSNENNTINLKQIRANRIPTLSGSATQGFSFGRSIDPTSNQYVTSALRTNNFSVGGSVILFNGLQNKNLIKQNQLAYEAGNLDVEAAKNDLKISIVESYYQILFSQEQATNALIQIQSTQAQIEKIQKQVDAGSLPELNFLQMKSTLATNNLTLVNAQNQVYLSKVTLMQLLNIPVSDNFNIEKPQEGELNFEPAKTNTTKDIYEAALTNQPRIKSLQLKKESSLSGVRVAKGSKLPRLSLNGNLFTNYSSAKTLNTIQTQYVQNNIGFLQSNPPQIVSAIVPENTVIRNQYPYFSQFRDNVSQTLSLSLSVPILNNRTARSNIEKAIITRQIAELNEANGKNDLRKTIEQAYADMTSAENTYLASKEALNSLELTYLNSEKRFNLGLTSPADFVIDKNNYYSAQVNLSFSKYQYILKSKVLEFYKTNQL
jgi:outer membrane protein